jgi:hypothetical protein
MASPIKMKNGIGTQEKFPTDLNALKTSATKSPFHKTQAPAAVTNMNEKATGTPAKSKNRTPPHKAQKGNTQSMLIHLIFVYKAGGGSLGSGTAVASPRRAAFHIPMYLKLRRTN